MSKAISRKEATQYRALVAWGIYLTQDRSDIEFAVKELSRDEQTYGDANRGE